MSIITRAGNIFLKIMLAGLPFGGTAQSIHLTPGVKMVAAGPVNLVLSNIAFVNDGTFIDNGIGGNSTVQITGSKFGSLGGASISSFRNLTINKANNSAFLLNDIHVTGVLSMTRGNFVLNGHGIDLETTGRVTGEVSNRSIQGVGFIKASIGDTVISNGTVNPGNLGMEMTSPANLSQITVLRSHVAEAMPNNGISIQRTFELSASQNSGVNAKLRFFYLDAELNGNKEDSLILWTGTSSGNFHSPLGKDSNNITANFVVKNNVDQLGHFTLSNMQSVAGIQSKGKTMTISGAGNQLDQAALSGELVSSVKAYPNPVQDQFTLELVSKETKPLMIGLYDGSGHLMQQKQVYCQAGKNMISWDLGGYNAGIYYLSFGNKGWKNIKIVKK